MTYPESQQILDHITKANRILLNCHSSPDADSVGSALAMYAVLTYLNKTVEIVCPNEIPSSLRFLQNSHLIQVVDYSSFDFSSFDLFITMDSSSWNRVSGNQTVPQPNVPIIVIDHHKTNDHFGIINLIQPRISANCELLYYLFADWNMTDTYFDSVPDYYNSIAEPLLTGILGDTGSLRFPEADQHTFKVASYLLGFADKNKIIRNLYQSYSLDHIYFWSKIMSMMKKEASGNFVWASIPFSIYEEYAHLTSAKSELADLLFQSIDDTDFGFIAIEESPRFVSVSFRSRTGVDVADIASKLEGGGHQWASAARIHDVDIQEATQKIFAAIHESL